VRDPRCPRRPLYTTLESYDKGRKPRNDTESRAESSPNAKLTQRARAPTSDRRYSAVDLTERNSCSQMPAVAVMTAAASSSATRKSNLAPEKRYKCQFCSRAFSRSEHRSRHERSRKCRRPFPETGVYRGDNNFCCRLWGSCAWLTSRLP
jgi:hypothetical protein